MGLTVLYSVRRIDWIFMMVQCLGSGHRMINEDAYSRKQHFVVWKGE
ncbi:hypothetical protein HMPREF1508_0852 [Shuttleworthella sp. MSX8B]|nr:hypothetical protein HMPREF1508_0852 [Shuttleworthia sp. MSX8B]